VRGRNSDSYGKTDGIVRRMMSMTMARSVHKYAD